MQVREITNRKEFQQIKGAWQSLFEAAGCDLVFLSWEWIDLWIKHFDEQEDWSILLAEEEDNVVGAAPLVHEAMLI